MTQKFSNNAASRLTTAITDAATSFTIEAGHADKFPVCTAAGDYFKVTIEDAQGNLEIVQVDSRAAGSNIFNGVTRGLEGTGAKGFPAGAIVELRFTAADAQSTLAHPAQSANAHNASAIAFAPTGSITSTQLQAALELLDTLKFAKAGGTISGDTTLNGRGTFTGGGETFTAGAQGKAEFRSSGNTPAFVAFHRPGAYAVYFGLDTDNQVKVGGWSMGGPYALYHTGNFDPGAKLSKSGDTASELYNNGWYRSNGAVGWYSETYGGGINMVDGSWVRVYGGKGFLTDAVQLHTNGYIWSSAYGGWLHDYIDSRAAAAAPANMLVNVEFGIYSLGEGLSTYVNKFTRRDGSNFFVRADRQNYSGGVAGTQPAGTFTAQGL